MRKSLLLVSISLLCVASHAQLTRIPVAAVYTHVNTYSSGHADPFSFAGNQAALASIKNFSIGAFGEKRFLLNELSLYSAAIAIPTGSGNVGVKADYFGGTDYNESQIGLAYARHLGNKLDIGVQFNYNSIKASTYGTAASINFDGGMIFHITNTLHAGIHAFNPTGSKLGKNEEEKLPAIYNVGLGYDASDKFFIGADIEKVEDMPVGVNAGMEYRFDEKLMARAGISTATSLFYLGFGFVLGNIRMDATASVHPQLGVSPGLMLIYTAKK